MKIVNLVAMVLMGASFGIEPCFAAPIGAGSHSRAITSFASDEFSGLIQVAKKKSDKKPKRKNNYNSGNGYIPGHVLTPYGYADCIGWWKRHSDGRMQCHGQLIRDR
jgi:hypothetical protein